MFPNNLDITLVISLNYKLFFTITRAHLKWLRLRFYLHFCWMMELLFLLLFLALGRVFKLGSFSPVSPSPSLPYLPPHPPSYSVIQCLPSADVVLWNYSKVRYKNEQWKIRKIIDVKMYLLIMSMDKRDLFACMHQSPVRQEQEYFLGSGFWSHRWALA